MSDWRPIETVPRDGTLVDLWIVPKKGKPRREPDCAWGFGNWWGEDDAYVIDHSCKVTHWMPRPDPPAAGSGPDDDLARLCTCSARGRENTLHAPGCEAVKALATDPNSGETRANSPDTPETN